MNRRGKPVPLKAAVCLLLCILAIGLRYPAALAEATAAGAQAEKTNALIIAPLRNKTFSGTDIDGIVMKELLYALQILRFSNTPLSVIPLLEAEQKPPAAAPVIDTLAQNTQKYEGILTGKPNTINNMNDSTKQTLDYIIQLAQKSDRHSTVILILDKAYEMLWTKLSELLQSTTADLLLLYLDNGESSQADIVQLYQVLGNDEANPDLKRNELITLTQRVQFMVLTKDHLASSYDALEPVLLAASGQARLPLIRSETESTVTLPELGVSNVMLVLKNIPEDYDIQITDQNGSVVNREPPYRDSSGRRILELPDVGGELTVTAYAAAAAQPPESGAADTQPPIPTDDPQAPAPPADGVEVTVLPTVTPAPAAQPAAQIGVEGTVLFDFRCEDTLLLSTRDGQPTYPKNTTVFLSVQPQGNILPGVLQSYPNVSGQLYVIAPNRAEEWYPLSVGDGQAEFTPKTVGIYNVGVELLIGDFYSVKSDLIMLDIVNQPPVTGNAPAAEYWIDNPYLPAVPVELDLAPMFSDPDQDSLQYSVASDVNSVFQKNWTDEQFARFSIQENILSITPLIPAGSREITIKAMDKNGGAAVIVVPIIFHSIYDALANVSIADTPVFSENVAKNAAVTITAYPQFPVDTSDQGKIESTFIANAGVTCQLKPEGSGKSITIQMEYDAQTRAYQATYTMPDTAAHYEVSVKTELIPPEGDTKHPSVSIVTDLASLSSENTAPQWIGDDATLGKPWMDQGENGEFYDLKLDFASLFTDAEDALPGMDSHLTLYLSIDDSAQRKYAYTAAADGVYLLTRRGKNAPEATPLPLPGKTPVVLRFQNEGKYTLYLTAQDPDGQKANGTLTLVLQSHTLFLYRAIGLALAALALLAGLCLLIARLLKPAFGEQTLRVSLSTRSDQMSWSVPLEAWRKRNVPLRWILLYGCVPPLPSLEPIASAVTIRPKRDGIQIVTKNDSLRWLSDREPLPQKFIQTQSHPPVTLNDADITLEITL